MAEKKLPPMLELKEKYSGTFTGLREKYAGCLRRGCSRLAPSPGGRSNTFYRCEGSRRSCPEAA